MESEGEPTQIQMFAAKPFGIPLEHDSWHYVPILKSMRGELDALDQATANVLDRLTPLIEADEQLTAGDPPRRSRTPNLPSRLAPVLTADRPFFLDFPWIETGARVLVGRTGRRQPVNAIECLLAGCRD